MNDQLRKRRIQSNMRGAFLNGTWHCDCDPRLPAEKFQTKNGGKNHGRWFYTCQKSQPKRCSFFLWSDDAEIREESAVLSNSRSEAYQTPRTPQKAPGPFARPITPESQIRPPMFPTSVHSAKYSVKFSTDDPEYDGWSSSGEEELVEFARDASAQRHISESPRKAVRTQLFDSPGKKHQSEIQELDSRVRQTSTDSTTGSSEDVFTTPSTLKYGKPPATGLISLTTLHRTTATALTSSRANAVTNISLPPTTNPSSITAEVLDLLSSSMVSLPKNVNDQLVSLLNRHDLRSQGIARGRDITRVAVQTKDKKIVELQEQITRLEAEAEIQRNVIRCLKEDIATSPKRNAGRGRPYGRKSEV